MYSVKEAAEKLNLSERRVRVLLKERRLEGVKVSRDWVVLDLEFERKGPHGCKIEQGRKRK